MTKIKSSPIVHYPLSITRQGFTLIEVIIVIAIIGIIVAFMLPNLAGVRSRARDAAKKGELHAIRTAMNLYHNQFGAYPPPGTGLTFPACGELGTDLCPCSATADWAAGGTGGCDNVFMQNITNEGSGFFFRYFSCNNGTDYRLKTTLENASDPDLVTSHARCPDSACDADLGDLEYVVCP